MFTCEYCNRSFSRKDHLARHGDCRAAVQICDVCGGIYKSEGALRRHKREKHEVPKAKRPAAAPIAADEPKRPRLDLPEASTSSSSPSSTRHCTQCNLTIPAMRWQGHLRTLAHRQKCSVVQEPGVEMIQTSFRNRIVTYRLASTVNPTDVKGFLDHLRSKILTLVESNVRRYGNVKVGMELFGNFLLQTKEQEEVKSFNTKYRLVSGNTDLEELYVQFVDILATKASEFQERDSGWALEELLHLEIGINKYNPLRASSYVNLPKEIEAKKAVLNLQNTDEKCFMWSILAALHPIHWTNNANRVSNYVEFQNELDFTGIDFPVKLKDISTFERLNEISVNVYGLERVYNKVRNDVEVVGPLHFTESRKERHVNLLLISNDYGENHYCLIRSMSRLVSKQLTKRSSTKFLCDGCLVYFYNEEKLKRHKEHDCTHISIKLPTTELRKDKYGKDVPANKLKFEEFEKKLKVPFVVYADFETVMTPLQVEGEPNPDKSFTVKTHIHEPYSFAYYVKCDFDDSQSTFKQYRGRGAHKIFIEWLESDCKALYNKFMKTSVPMTTLSFEQETGFRNAVACHICEKPFNAEDEKVRDHCHMTGEFRGAAHFTCNLNFKVPRHIPVFFHHLGFDSHLFVKVMAEEGEKIDVIAQNKERYISFTKHVLVDNIESEKGGKGKRVFLKLRFLDSFRFMASSLDRLSRKLNDSQCREVKKIFKNEQEFQLIRQKGVFPYTYLDSFSKLDETKLPSHEDFYDSMRKSNITREDYKRAWTVWNLFKCKTLGEYSDIYLKSDVLLLADIFENFREVCLKTYGLDPSQFYTTPGLSWTSALKATKVELDLLTDVDMIHFLKYGIRGGVSQCSVRKAAANNKFLPNYDPSKPISYVMYATNLYGAAMSQYLPTGNFEWLEEGKIQNLDITRIPNDSPRGYIFEVDLDYPEVLHDAHNELPFCPESIVSPIGKTKMRKLIPNLNNKRNYVLHYRNLQQALSNGLKLVRIHRVLVFDQSPWLKQYIDLNTAMRNTAKNKFEKDFFKLMNNAVFGKPMENVDKRVDVRLVSHWENIGKRLGAEALIARPNFKNVAIFSENLVALQMERTKVVYDKPIYAGFCILDISKTLIYDFFYGYLKAKYGDKAVLLYTDTDSLVVQIFCENFYEDMKENLDKFDTSNYSENNQHGIPVNKSVLGKMKDEYAGRPLWEFLGTGAKAYCVNVDGNELTKKAKGVADSVSQRELSLDDYKRAVHEEGTLILRQMSSFRSHLHDMYVELKNKVALSYADDKRHLIPGSEYTLAWGHRNLVGSKDSGKITD
ncbi:uncharacterized protein LOC132702478 isoform X2 [Cylas formicarius]|uniref:uncharacterized protein LOC132702478 isoform X2 n=1 Tax=Cylas formicarius TaxID=197179 RepID=UPI0029589FC3|nr:uncharacterized protein LOC132702478 isoform X2 [Cylas formicarius]